MAAVVPGLLADSAAYLPLILMGGAAIVYATQTEDGKAPKPREKSKEERHQELIQWDMETGGLDAVASQVLMHKYVNQSGYAVHPEAGGYDLRGGGYQPDQNIDPLQEVFEKQQKLLAYDRLHSERGLHYAIPETRLDFKRTPIVAALTEEVHHPDDPMMVSNFRNDLQIPSHANQRELKEAKANMARNAQNGPSAMNYAEVEYLNRAYGQSFRYEE